MTTTATVQPTSSSQGISKIWQFFRSSFVDRPNESHGSGLTAFKKEWEELPETDRQQIREGISDGSFTY